VTSITTTSVRPISEETDALVMLAKHAAYVPLFLIGLSFESYAILGVLMAADVFTGIIRTAVINGWTSVKSRRLSSGIIAKVVIVGVPLVLVWAGRGAGIDLLPVAKGALGMLVLSEAYSILGNIHAIYLRQDVPEFDAISFVLKKIRGIVERVVKSR